MNEKMKIAISNLIFAKSKLRGQKKTFDSSNTKQKSTLYGAFLLFFLVVDYILRFQTPPGAQENYTNLLNV